MRTWTVNVSGDILLKFLSEAIAKSFNKKCLPGTKIDFVNCS